MRMSLKTSTATRTTTSSMVTLVFVAVMFSIDSVPLLSLGEDMPQSSTTSATSSSPSPSLHPMTYMCRNGHLDAIAARSYRKSTISHHQQNGNEEEGGGTSTSSAPLSVGSLWEGAVGATNWLWGSLKQALVPPSPPDDDGHVQKIPSADSDENELSSVEKMTAGHECRGYFSSSDGDGNYRGRYPNIMGISERHQAQTATSNVHIFSGLLSLKELRETTKTTAKPVDSAITDEDGLAAATKAHLLETLIYLHGKMYGQNPSASITNTSSFTPPPLPTAESLDALLNDTEPRQAEEGGRTRALRSSVLLIAPGGSYEKLSPFETNAIPLQALGYSSIMERSLVSPSARSTSSTTSKPFNLLPVVVQYRVRPLSPFSPAHDISQAVRFLERVKRNVGASSTHHVPTPAALGLSDNFTITIAGFSAGGHAVGTYLAKLNSPTNTVVKAAALIYPVISLFDNDLLNRKSRANLFSGTTIFESPPNNTDSPQTVPKPVELSLQQKLLSRAFSLELHPENFPPYVYLAHSREDSTVPVENSIQMFTSLVKHRKAFRRHGKHRSSKESTPTGDQQIFNEHQSYQGGEIVGARATNDVTLNLYTNGAHGRWLFTPRLEASHSEAASQDWFDKLETWLATFL